MHVSINIYVLLKLDSTGTNKGHPVIKYLIKDTIITSGYLMASYDIKKMKSGESYIQSAQCSMGTRYRGEMWIFLKIPHQNLIQV